MYAFYGTIFCILLLLPGWHALTPLKVWCASWAVSWITHAVLAGVYFVSEEALFLVFLGNTSFVLGCIFHALIPHRRSINVHAREEAISAYLSGESARVLFCYIFLTLSFISIIFAANQMGGGLVSSFKNGIFESMRLANVALYDGNEFTTPSGVKVATMMVSATSILAGLTLASPKRKAKSMGLIFFLPYGVSVLLLSAVSGVRSFMLVAGLFLLFSYVSARSFLNLGKSILSFKMICYSSAAVVAFLLVVLVMQSARLQDSNFQNVAGTVQHLRPWFGGYIPALSVWYETNQSPQLGFGTYMLRGLLAPLNLASGEGFDERIDFSWIGNGQSSNAMTMFRVIWSDFGPIGGAIFCFFWGVLSSYVFRLAMSRGKQWLVVLSCFYCAIFFSINYWFFSYGARIFGAALATIAVHLSIKFSRKPRTSTDA